MKDKNAREEFASGVSALQAQRRKSVLYRVEDIVRRDGYCLMQVRPNNVVKALSLALPLNKEGKRPLEIGDSIGFEYSRDEKGLHIVKDIAGERHAIIEDCKALSPDVVYVAAWEKKERRPLCGK